MRRFKKGISIRGLLIKSMSILLSLLMIISISAPPLASLAAADIYEAMDTVAYNLGGLEISVGNDVSQAESAPSTYKLFDADGSYTIQLEANAFFPYEVQFIAGGDVFTVWFDAPDSTAQIADHTFYVYSEQNDDTKLRQIGAWVGDEYIAAYPAPKSFTNNTFSVMSLLPLNTVEVSLDLTSFDLYQFSNVSFATILNGMSPPQSIASDAKVVWARLYNDNYEISARADSINLYDAINEYGDKFQLELIVGSALQLDANNTRYIINVTTDVPAVLKSLEIYAETGGTRKAAAFTDERHYNS